MPLVLFNIGWMKHYRGITGSDRIFNGGRYIDENETGGEVQNFLPLGDYCYGYVQPNPGGNEINLRRLGAEYQVDYFDGVTVIFTATRPNGGRVVVGWFNEARVWRNERHRGDHHYFARALRENCFLLDPDDRIFPVPGGNNVVYGLTSFRTIRYLDRPEAELYVQMLVGYMNDVGGFNLPDEFGNVPHNLNPTRRMEVERAAVDYVIDHYEGRGFNCDSVERDNKGWDLEARRGAVELLIEVKGCSGDVGQVELTPNEYSAMTNRQYRESYRLAIVTQALDENRRSLSIISYNGSDKTWRDQDGRRASVKKRIGARIGLQ